MFSDSRNLYKKIYLIIFALLVGFLTYKSFYFFAECYFFDQFFYKKSAAHGYYNLWPRSNEDWSKIATDFNADHRNDDLLYLINVMMNDREALDYFAKEKEKNVFKIVLIGDSMFFGSGLRKKQTLSYFLQKELGKKVKVYNFSYSGDDILDNYAKYKFIKEYLDPDVFVLELLNNDLALTEISRYPSKSSIYENLGLDLSEDDLISQKQITELRDYLKTDNYEKLVFNLYAPSFKQDSKYFPLLEAIAAKFDLSNIILLPWYCTDSYKDNPTECDDEDELICLEKSIYKSYLSSFNGDKTILDVCNLEYDTVSKREGHPGSTTNKSLAESLARLIEEKYLKN
jgi:hypothetical protein